MVLRIEVEPKLLAWAVARSRKDSLALHGRFAQLGAWLDGSLLPTLKQLEAFAKATHTPVGFLFLREPPQETLPIPDYRTLANARLGRPSPDLLDTIHICQQRQDWYRDHARSNGLEPLRFIGSASIDSPIEAVATDINRELKTDLDTRRAMHTRGHALKDFISRAEDAGILVMCNGIVLNNTSRRLDPAEFRGFALADKLAPLVFINGADSKAAQMFTLAHELAHLWLGETGLSNTDLGRDESQAVECWCNAVAAEQLVPRQLLEAELRQEPLPDALLRLTRLFKVSSLVMLRRMKDVGHLAPRAFAKAYQDELERLLNLDGGQGGNFYLSQPYRLSRRFSRALIASALEGQTLYRDAMRMLGVRKTATFNELAHTLGILA